MYFLTPKNLPAPSSYKFKQGINQSFPATGLELDISVMTLNHILKFKEDYFPLIINIETLNPSIEDEHK